MTGNESVPQRLLIAARCRAGEWSKGQPTDADGSAVLYKLVTFAILMAVAPIGSYFGTLRYLWNGE